MGWSDLLTGPYLEGPIIVSLEIQDSPRTIPEALVRRRTNQRGITFITLEGKEERWTFEDLADVARLFGGGWQEFGVRRGDRVGILGSTTPEFVGALFGCWAIGAIPVPIAIPLRLSDPIDIVKAIRFRLQKCDAVLMAADRRFLPFQSLFEDRERVIFLDEIPSKGREASIVEVDEEEPALIQFTSGSTQRPRGVVLSHRAIIGNGMASWERLKATTADVAVSWLPLYHDFGLIGCTVWPAVLGNNVETVLMPPELFLSQPRIWMEAISKYGGTLTGGPNFAYGLMSRSLASAADLDLSSIRIAACGGEPIDIGTLKRFCEAGAPFGFAPDALSAGYGLAEATLAVTMPDPLSGLKVLNVDPSTLESGYLKEIEPIDSKARPLVSLGRALSGVTVRIIDEEGRTIPEEQVGQISVRTDYSMTGYVNDPEESSLVLGDGWIRTGDLGVLRGDSLYFAGRLKDVIAVAGRKIHAQDIEFAAESVPGIRKGNAVAFATNRSEMEALVIVAESSAPKDEQNKLTRQVSDAVLRQVGLRPAEIHFVSPKSLPKTPSGKRQRTLVRAMYLDGALEASIQR